MGEIKIGVIGVGGRGTLSDLFNSDEFNTRVFAGADTDESQLAAFKGRNNGVEFTTTDYKEMLGCGDINAVGVFSPTSATKSTRWPCWRRAKTFSSKSRWR